MGVQAAFLDQLIVSADLLDLTALHRDDLIGVLNSGKPVSHDEGSAIFHEGCKGGFDLEFTFGVQGTGGLVKDENWCILQKGSSD